MRFPTPTLLAVWGGLSHCAAKLSVEWMQEPAFKPWL